MSSGGNFVVLIILLATITVAVRVLIKADNCLIFEGPCI